MPTSCRTARARLIKTGSPMANHDMIHQAKRRLASHIALDWRCATNPDPFAADVHSARPNSRRAFFKRWGCLCRVNAGNYTLEECADPDRCLLINDPSPPYSLRRRPRAPFTLPLPLISRPKFPHRQIPKPSTA